MALLSSCNSIDILPVGILTTVGIKELLDKEQIGFKELFTDYKPFIKEFCNRGRGLSAVI